MNKNSYLYADAYLRKEVSKIMGVNVESAFTHPTKRTPILVAKTL